MKAYKGQNASKMFLKIHKNMILRQKAEKNCTCSMYITQEAMMVLDRSSESISTQNEFELRSNFWVN